MTDLFESLMRDHREVEKLFAAYRENGEDATAHAICDALAVHAQAEEEVLYPEVRRLVDDGDDLANQAEAEHAAAQLLIARVYEAPPIDLHELIAELQSAVELHVASEENALFPKLREAGADAEALGQKLTTARAEATSRSSNQVG
jgi:hemerythrin superfamily protein